MEERMCQVSKSTVQEVSPVPVLTRGERNVSREKMAILFVCKLLERCMAMQAHRQNASLLFSPAELLLGRKH